MSLNEPNSRIASIDRMGWATMATRQKQLAYSEIQDEMSRVETRVRKAAKIQAVLDHFLGDGWAPGAKLLDIGASVGWTVEAAAQRGAFSMGVDIDVPGLARATRERDAKCHFICADGEALPFPDGSLDVVVFNHIYEHVVDPDAILAEIRRVLSPTGVVYLGLGNRLGVIEPHYRLPFLSWLPQNLADRYIRAAGKADEYYEQYRTVPGLQKMAGGLYIHDYSFTIIANPDVFGAGDQVGGPVPGLMRKVPTPLLTPARMLLPTVIWIGSKSPNPPKGRDLPIPPQPVVTKLVAGC